MMWLWTFGLDFANERLGLRLDLHRIAGRQRSVSEP